MAKFKKLLSIPILAVFLLVGFVYYITVFIFIEDWVGLRSSSGSLNALIFTFLASLCVFSFFVCVLTDPGHVPASYVPDVEESDEQTNGNSVQSKLCDKCSTYKPPRAHHCRVCKRCVLRMDHHCMWVNNCVGYWNYKAFFVLVFYATIASIYSTVMVISCSFQKDWEFSGYLPLKIFYVTCGVMMVSLSLTLGTLLGWHIYLINHNMTTIEYYEGIRTAWLTRKSGQNYRHPFNVSAYRNITLVLGPNMLKWLCPTSVSHLKGGLSFPVSRDSS
ncbi:probable protein S-acyltransferase 15 [Morus notabilis]|uniref:probable protein S-acyltransferase 15 n=1 Tax=Morus notabilis TaxID=981085 RepID=UPI000CECFD8C|nr:probable protein S-acyltransferase 15 [Morus notabilis]